MAAPPPFRIHPVCGAGDLSLVKDKRLNNKVRFHAIAPPGDTKALRDFALAPPSEARVLKCLFHSSSPLSARCPPSSVLLRYSGTYLAKRLVAAVLSVGFVDEDERRISPACVAVCADGVCNFAHSALSACVLMYALCPPVDFACSVPFTHSFSVPFLQSTA